MTADDCFDTVASELGHRFDGEIKIGGNYVPLVQDGDRIYVSGQIPRVGDQVLFVGAVGEQLDLDTAKTAAKVCVMRALALLQRSAGSLDAIRAVPRITVYLRSAPGFTQQSEVADGASEVLFKVLGPAGAHSRTSVGVLQLPKGAAIEVDLIASVSANAGSAALPCVKSGRVEAQSRWAPRSWPACQLGSSLWQASGPNQWSAHGNASRNP